MGTCDDFAQTNAESQKQKSDAQRLLERDLLLAQARGSAK